MAHHAYVWSGEAEEGIARVRGFASHVLGISGDAHPDFLIFRHGLFSVEDARKLASFTEQGPIAGTHKAIIISVTRFFHEAQNALLKIFEEPPAGVVLFLIVPTEGILLPTLRSRLVPLPQHVGHRKSDITVGLTMSYNSAAETFLEGNAKARETFIGKLLERTKSDKEEVKQAARSEAIQLIEGITHAAHASWEKSGDKNLQVLLSELETFLPILHERSAPYKLIFEHLLLVTPETMK